MLSIQNYCSSKINYFPSRVPVEITELVISHLNKQDLLSVAKSCKHFYRLVINLDMKSYFPRGTTITDKERALYVSYKALEKTFHEKTKHICLHSFWGRSYYFTAIAEGNDATTYIAFLRHRFNKPQEYGILYGDILRNKWTSLKECARRISSLFFSKAASKLIFFQHNSVHFLSAPKFLPGTRPTPSGESALCFEDSLMTGALKNTVFFTSYKKTLVRIDLETLQQTTDKLRLQTDIECLHCPEEEKVVLVGSCHSITVLDDVSLTVLQVILLPKFSWPQKIFTFQKHLLITLTYSKNILKTELTSFRKIEDTTFKTIHLNKISNVSMAHTKHNYFLAADHDTLSVYDIPMLTRIKEIKLQKFTNDFFVEDTGSLTAIRSFQVDKYKSTFKAKRHDKPNFFRTPDP